MVLEGISLDRLGEAARCIDPYAGDVQVPAFTVKWEPEIDLY